MYDYVKCNYCETMQTVPRGEEECPICGQSGFLSWVEGAPNELEDPIKPIGPHVDSKYDYTPVKVGHRLKLGYICDCDPHNSADCVVTRVHSHRYYPNRDPANFVFRTQIEVQFADGSKTSVARREIEHYYNK